MLAIKRSACVAPEVNLRNPLDVNEGSILALKPRADVTKSPKVKLPFKKGLVSSIFFKKTCLLKFFYNFELILSKKTVD